MKRKKIIISSTFLAFMVLVMIVSMIIIFNSETEKTDIHIANWYDYGTDEVTLSLSLDTVSYYLPECCSCSIVSENDILVELTKNENYIETRPVFRDSIYFDSVILFKNNNYYFAHETPFENKYCIVNLASNIVYNGLSFFVPMQDCFYFANSASSSLGTSHLDDYFLQYSFSDSMIFYSRFTDYVSIDSENEKISIKATDFWSRSQYSMTIDYSNKAITLTDATDTYQIYPLA